MAMVSVFNGICCSNVFTVVWLTQKFDEHILTLVFTYPQCPERTADTIGHLLMSERTLPLTHKTI